MNKYLYKIEDLNLPTWIKYWFSKRSKINFDLSEILNGTSFDLTNTVNKKLHLINIFGNSVQNTSILPSEYQQVEYIESTGTQHINTGILSALDLRIECEYDTTTSNKALLGARTSSSEDCLTFGYFHNTTSYFASYGGSSNDLTGTISNYDNDKHKVVMSNDAFTIDEVEQPISRGEINNSNEIYLFTWNNNGTADSRKFVGRIYSFKIYKNNLVRDYIPCYRKSDNVIGLYDLVSKTFFTNAGTGTFNKGNDVTLPTVNYPQSIKSAGDNGSLVEKFVNKNWFDAYKCDWSEGVGASYSIVNLSEVIVSSSNAWARRNCDISGLQPNTQYVISATKVNTQNLLSGFYISGDTVSSAMTRTNGSIYLPFNSNEQGKATIQFYTNWSNTSVQHSVTYSDIQIEKGSVKTDYETHQEQTHTIPCQQPMRAIGNVKDRFVKVNGVWYERHNIARILSYNGEEITTAYMSTTGELSTGATVDYVLTTPTDLICTTTQITALEELQKAKTYDGVTHIYSDDEVPPNLEIQYYKEKEEE